MGGQEYAPALQIEHGFHGLPIDKLQKRQQDVARIRDYKQKLHLMGCNPVKFTKCLGQPKKMLQGSKTGKSVPKNLVVKR